MFYEAKKIVEASNWSTSYDFVDFTCDNKTSRHARGCKPGRVSQMAIPNTKLFCSLSFIIEEQNISRLQT